MSYLYHHQMTKFTGKKKKLTFWPGIPAGPGIESPCKTQVSDCEYSEYWWHSSQEGRAV